MASGFGYFHSSDNIVAGYGNIYVSGFIAQNVNTSTRKVTITVTALLTYYRRAGGSWNPGTSVIFENYTAGNYIQATLDGSSASDGTHLGLKGANTTLTVGNYYDDYTGGVSACNIAQVVKSTTYDYDASGAAITKSWSCSINYAGSVLTVSGSVTTDSIPASGSAPSDGYINGVSSYYSNGRPWIHADSAGVNDGGLSLSALDFAVTDRTYGPGVPGRYISFTNGGQVNVSETNSKAFSDGNVFIDFNTRYYTGITAINSKGTYRYQGPTVVTIPAPASFSVRNIGADSVEVVYFTAADGGYDQVVVQYSLDNSTWADAAVVNDSTIATQGGIIVTGLTPGVSNTIYLRTLNGSGGSKITTLTVTAKKAVLYGSVNGDSEEIIKLYGSVGGESKAIKKLYGSVNGRAKLIYKEN